MSGRNQTPAEPDRQLIANALNALAALDAATRTKSGLAKRAGISRVTLNKVVQAGCVRGDTLMALDDAVQVPPGTLQRLGEGDPFDDLGLNADQLATLVRTSHSKGRTRNRRVV